MLKTIFAALAFLASFQLQAATSVRTVYSNTPVTTSAWRQLVASTPAITESVAIFDSSGQTLEIGIGAPGSEAVQMIIPPGGGSFPFSVSQGLRISMKALSSTASTGESDINFFSK